MSDPAPAPTVLHYEAIAWDRPLESADPASRPPEELVREAERLGARRKKLARGEAGFFMNRSVLPAGYRILPHSHDHSELMVVLRGGCQFDDGMAELGENDAIVIHAHTHYGITAGPDGLEFLTIRTGEAQLVLENG